jgi:PEP-utilising enzyme, mobile domain
MSRDGLTKWSDVEKTPTVAFFHERIRRHVAERARVLGKPWPQLATEHTLELLSADDLRLLERELLDQGYRFDCSATVSQREAPEKYKPRVEAAKRAEVIVDADGRSVVGHGDNLVESPSNFIGVARLISTIDQVTDMLINGVPPDSVAVIDDSGGTLTAPILEDFKAVLCLGGTVRSHLGILTREYGIPCFMNCKFDAPLADGDRVELELTTPAVTGEDYETGRNVRARIWKLR